MLLDFRSANSPQVAKAFWNVADDRKRVAELGVALKCHYKDAVSILLVRANTRYQRLMERLSKLFPGNQALQIFVEHEGDRLPIANDEDLTNALQLAQGNTLIVALEDTNQPRSEPQRGAEKKEEGAEKKEKERSKKEHKRKSQRSHRSSKKDQVASPSA